MSAGNRSIRSVLVLAVLALGGLPGPSAVAAPQGQGPTDNVQQLATVANRLRQRLPADKQNVLSAGGRALLALGERAPVLQPGQAARRPSCGRPSGGASAAGGGSASAADVEPGMGQESVSC